MSDTEPQMEPSPSTGGELTRYTAVADPPSPSQDPHWGRDPRDITLTSLDRALEEHMKEGHRSRLDFTLRGRTALSKNIHFNDIRINDADNTTDEDADANDSESTETANRFYHTADRTYTSARPARPRAAGSSSFGLESPSVPTAEAGEEGMRRTLLQPPPVDPLRRIPSSHPRPTEPDFRDHPIVFHRQEEKRTDTLHARCDTVRDHDSDCSDDEHYRADPSRSPSPAMDTPATSQESADKGKDRVLDSDTDTSYAEQSGPHRRVRTRNSAQELVEGFRMLKDGREDEGVSRMNSVLDRLKVEVRSMGAHNYTADAQHEKEELQQTVKSLRDWIDDLLYDKLTLEGEVKHQEQGLEATREYAADVTRESVKKDRQIEGMKHRAREMARCHEDEMTRRNEFEMARHTHGVGEFARATRRIHLELFHTQETLARTEATLAKKEAALRSMSTKLSQLQIDLGFLQEDEPNRQYAEFGQTGRLPENPFLRQHDRHGRRR